MEVIRTTDTLRLVLSFDASVTGVTGSGNVYVNGSSGASVTFGSFANQQVIITGAASAASNGNRINMRGTMSVTTASGSTTYAWESPECLVMAISSGGAVTPTATNADGGTIATTDAIAKATTGYNKVLYYSKAGNDSNDGLTPATAKLTLTNAVINAQPAGTLIIVGPGAFTLGSPGRLVFPDYVSMRGAGMYATTITGTSAALNDTTIKPGTGSVFEDFTLVSAQDSVQFDYPFGTATKEELDPDFDYTELRRVRIVGDTDCIIVRYQGRVRCVDCQLESQYDTIVGAGATYELINTNIRIIGPGAPGSHSQGTARGIYDVGRLYMHGGSVSVRDGGNTQVAGIRASASTLSMDLFGVKIATSNTGSAAPKDIIVDAGAGPVRLFGCEFDASKTTGTYTSLNVPTAVQVRQEIDSNSTKLDATVSSRSTLTAAQVNAEADTALADAGVTTTVTGRIDAAISSRLASASYTAPLTAQQTADAMKLAPSAGSAAAGSVQDKLDTISGGSGGDSISVEQSVISGSQS